MTVCTDCGGTVIEYDAAAGNGFCVNCGTVVEENTIVNEVTFGETSNGAAMVHGSFVAQGATHARMGGPFGNRGNSESREQTIANASRKIQQICHHFRLSENVSLAATRLYTLALEHKFTRGRKSMHVVAVCVYVACRQKETRNYMLIDFSDLLQVNVFELGHTYLQLVRTLNLRLPPIDPSHHISRFAALLEFGDETPRVAVDATRLVARMDRDWLARGRRPSGICGAALLLAARMNNFRRSVAEIVQVVKIADSTVRKRLEEFKKTGSAALSVGDFRSVWLEEENEPPAFVRGREKEEREKLAGEDVEGEGSEEVSKGSKGKGKARGKGKKRKRKRGEDTDEDEDIDVEPSIQQDEGALQDAQETVVPVFDPALLHQGILAGTTNEPLFLPDDYAPPPPEETLADDESVLVNPTSLVDGTQEATNEPVPKLREATPIEASLDAALTEEVSSFLETAKGAQLSEALDDADAQRVAGFSGDQELEGLDEEELDAFLLTEEEVRMKERVWVEMNRDYLENLAAKAELEQSAGEQEKKKRKKRKTTSNKPRDASTPHGATAAESVKNLLKKNPRYSKRINYDALRDLFDGGVGGQVEEQKVNLDTEMYTMDPEKEEDEMGNVVVVEEGGGGVGTMQAPSGKLAAVVVEGGDEDGEGDVDDDMYADKGDDYGGEWDGYEQEV
ncbi:Brf1-like TBP-binding domain-containing protein [Irpex rosettiformis]|uniref:Brf1-like TBP-binding domain-containing protein n=1 Tax=Irpex rosettiformis TaxID=378272 RepID=A0ACB8TVF0_9APHY|nr:Brf1-like TBP-binding domain-containing protein [Irpex rosettiformis]